MNTATKTIAGITYVANFHYRNGKFLMTTYTHVTEKGIKAVAHTATRKLAELNSAFRKEIAEAKTKAA